MVRSSNKEHESFFVFVCKLFTGGNKCDTLLGLRLLDTIAPHALYFLLSFIRIILLASYMKIVNPPQFPMALPRVSSRTPLYYEHRRNSSASPIPPAMIFGLPVSHFLGPLQPRKIRYRSTFLAVAVLFIITTYILVHHTILSPRVLHLKDQTTAAQMAAALDNVHILNSLGSGKKHRPLRQGTQIKLDAAQELAAVSSFLASLPQNHIPPSVDPSVPIDPQLVLDFDTSSLRAADEVQAMVDDVWLQNPVFLYSKVCRHVSRVLVSYLFYFSIALLLRVERGQGHACKHVPQA